VASGGPRSLLRRARRARLPLGALDREQSHDLQPPFAGIHGWALAEHGLGRIEVTIDGERSTRARLFAEPRPDVAALTPQPSAPVCGWEAPIDLEGLEPGSTVTIGATAEGKSGRRSLGACEMRVGAPRSTPDPDPQWLATLAERATAETQPPALSEELRVAVFTHQLDLGGAQLYLQELLRHLLRDERVSCAVYAQADGPLRAELERWGVRVHITGQEPRLGSIYESRMSELALLVGRFRPNVALVNTSLAFWGVDLAQRLGIPSAWAIHESVPVAHYPHQVWPPFDAHLRERFVASLGLADRVVFEAEATHELYRDYVDDAQATRIDYGIDLERIDRERRDLDREQLRGRLGIAPDDRVVLCMGTIEPRKAQASLALAFARLAEAMPNASLVLVGDRDLPYSRGVREAVARMPLADGRIRIVPLAKHTSEWYELADAFALPSDLESLPRSILEAMAFELPVLAADAFGVTEVVADGVNGIVCEPRCLDSLTSGLCRLLELPGAELAALGHAGAAQMRSERDSRGYGAAYLDLLAELVAARGRPSERAA
jgi:glycosyltransferase involved in cell wall biosynthesis